MRLYRFSSLHAPASRLISRMTPRARRLYALLEGGLLLVLATTIALYVQF